MKNLLFYLVLCLAGSAFSQTKQIAHKSHSGAKNEFFSSDYIDNFGEPPQIIDSIIILKNKCIVEIFTYQFYGRDTVCEHPYFTQGYSEAEIRALYPPKVVFVGFEHYKPGKKNKKGNEKPASHYRKNRYKAGFDEKGNKKSSFHFLAILVALSLGTTYIFRKPKA